MSDTAPERPAEAARNPLDDLDDRELALVDATAAMYAAVYLLSDPELNALFDAVLVARGQATRDDRPRLVAYFERTGEWLLHEFARRSIQYHLPRRDRERVTAALPVVRPEHDQRA